MKHTRTAALRVEQREGEGDGGESEALPGFRGHAAVFNQPTLIGTTRFGFVEQIAPGAFEGRTDDDVRFLFNHDGMPMARTKNGSLRLREDSVGLQVEADFADTQLSRDMVALLERGDIDQMSFAFTIDEESRSEYDGDVEAWRGLPLYTITRVGQLYDVATVTYPAYDGTDAGLRTGYRGLSVTTDEITLRLGEPEEQSEGDLPEPVIRRLSPARRFNPTIIEEK